MASNTTRLNLLKPAGPEYVNVVTQINNNFDTIDKHMGATWVNDGVTLGPADLFDGKIVKEIGTKRTFYARTNGGGGYNMIRENSGEWAFFDFAITSQPQGVVFPLGAGGISRANNSTLSNADLTVSGNNLIFNQIGVYTVTVMSQIGAIAANRRFIEAQITPDTNWAFREEGTPSVQDIGMTFNLKVDAQQTMLLNGYHLSGANNTFTSKVRVIRHG